MPPLSRPLARSIPRRPSRGVTLLELLVAVLVVAILSVVAGNVYRSYVQKGQLTHVQAELGQAQLLLERSANASPTGVYPASIVGVVPTDANFTFAYTVPAGGATDYALLATGQGPAANVLAAVNSRQVRCFCKGAGCTALVLNPTDLVCPSGATTF